MENFKLFGGYVIDNLSEYCGNYIKNNPDVKLYVGTDSKQLRKKTLYATTICFYHDKHGGHIIYKRIKINKIRDIFTRLWHEVELSKEVTDYLTKELKGIYDNKICVDLDLNPSDKYKSNMVYNAGVGLINGCGYECRTKPDAWAASCAADLLCK